MNFDKKGDLNAKIYFNSSEKNENYIKIATSLVLNMTRQ